MNELNKVKHISYSPNSGEVTYKDEDLLFNQGDQHTAFLHLRGTMEGYIRAELKIKTPNGEVVLLISKVITNNKNVCREFELIVDEAGKYQAQLILSYKDKTNVSNIFSYTVNKSIEGGN